MKYQNPTYPLLTDIFSVIYIINLPEREDRYQEMKSELKRVGLSYHEKKIKVFPGIKPADPGDFPSIGARGCFLSHLEILKNAKKSRVDSVLIMEDDLATSLMLPSSITLIKSKLAQQHWSLCYLGHIVPVKPDGDLDFIIYNQPILTCHFYAVNGNILDRLIAFLEIVKNRPAVHPKGGPMHFDGALNTFRQQNPDIITLLATPSLGYQRSSRSDIAPAKWFDSIRGVNFAVAQLRKIRNQLKSW